MAGANDILIGVDRAGDHAEGEADDLPTDDADYYGGMTQHRKVHSIANSPTKILGLEHCPVDFISETFVK